MTKPYTTLAALRLADRSREVADGGFLLELDAPAVPIADDWLTRQGLTTVTEIWKNDLTTPPAALAMLPEITTRQLLSMQSGLADYNDRAMELWSYLHRGADINPSVWLQNSSHNLEFQPGSGAAYSGNGFVLAGMVIAAAAGAHRWEELDQLGLLNELAAAAGEPPFNRTIFAGTGPCSAHPHVVHSYGIKPTLPHELGAAYRVPRSAAAPPHQQQSRCSWGPDQFGRLSGHVFGQFTMADCGSCCAVANRTANLHPNDVGF